MPLPAFSARSTFETCVESYQEKANAGLKARLRLIAPLIAAAEAAFVQAARADACQTIASADQIGSITKKEMVALYDLKLVKAKEARKIYLAIKGGAGARCPLCGHRGVDTLDHYLDKALHPALAVTPANLVPACFPCNRKKMGHHPTNAEAFTFHPYFDDLGGGVWLQARVEQTSPPAIRYELVQSAGWTQTLGARTRTHFHVLQLRQLYATEAAQEILNIRWQLGEVFARSGAGGVASHLQEAAASRRLIDPNSWQTAMYAATAADAWFCAGGFKA